MNARQRKKREKRMQWSFLWPTKGDQYLPWVFDYPPDDAAANAEAIKLTLHDGRMSEL